MKKYNLIPKGLCKCSCGGKTKIATRNHKKCNFVKGEPIKFIKGHNQRGHKWNNGKTSASGYIQIRNINHNRANLNGYVYEHIIIAEKILGKSLPKGAEIHHTKEKTNNHSFVICENHSYHMFLHTRIRALEECGDVNKRK